MTYSSVSTSAASKRTNSFVNMNEYSAWAFEVIVFRCTVLIIKHQKKIILTDSWVREKFCNPTAQFKLLSETKISTDSWVKASTNLMKLSSSTTPFLELVYSSVATSELPTTFTAIVILILKMTSANRPNNYCALAYHRKNMQHFKTRL